MKQFARRAAGFVACIAASAAGGCQSTETSTADAPTRTSSQFMSATELASRLRLDRGAIDDTGKLVLTAPADGGEILLFADTTVVTVNGTPFKTSEPIDLRGGEAWLTTD